MSAQTYNVLFLCTGKSARSILAEASMNAAGQGAFHAYSAGSQPKGEVHPLALDRLRKAKLPVEGLRSKSWSEFAVPGAPTFSPGFYLVSDARSFSSQGVKGGHHVPKRFSYDRGRH
jgi:arsenate reductase